ncbi:MAG: hypothetical protein Q9187_003696 [Circinaria calcarea]
MTPADNYELWLEFDYDMSRTMGFRIGKKGRFRSIIGFCEFFIQHNLNSSNVIDGPYLDSHYDEANGPYGLELSIQYAKHRYYPYFQLAREVFPDSDSVDCLALANKWLNDCTERHEQCQRATISYLPKRVLQIDYSEGHPRIHLHQTLSDGETGTYVALSHCWGGNIAVKTLKCNISQYEQHIPWQDIPQTFRDAIEITKRLKFKYIWIDALCIIQDDSTDWDREAVKMKSYYSNAALCISASDAVNSRAGIFCERRIQFLKVEACNGAPSHEKCEVFIRCTDAKGHTGRLESKVLHTRAWVLQEHLTAPAILHWGKDILAWECRKHYMTEDGWSTITHPLHKSLLEHDDGSRPYNDEDHLYDSWYIVVYAYTHRKLTFSKDKLIALDGLAHQYRDLLDDKYLAGLWLHDLPRGLLWMSSTSRFSTYHAPSWSWASMDGSAAYFRNVFIYGQRLLQHNYDMQVFNAYVEYRNGQESGQVQSGTLYAAGILQKTRWISDLGHPEWAGLDLRTLKPKNRHFELDDVDTNPEIVWCLRVGTWDSAFGYGDRYNTFILILEEADTTSTEFKRLGIGFVGSIEPLGDIFADTTRQEFTII